MCRRCGEPDQRGPAWARRKRRQWLLDEYGDGTTVPCTWGCGTVLTYLTLEVDRLIPGWAGGTYRRDNILPACGPCNRGRSHGSFGEAPDGCNMGAGWPERRAS